LAKVLEVRLEVVLERENIRRTTQRRNTWGFLGCKELKTPRILM
jgi:hypothetical protein